VDLDLGILQQLFGFLNYWNISTAVPEDKALPALEQSW